MQDGSLSAAPQLVSGKVLEEKVRSTGVGSERKPKTNQTHQSYLVPELFLIKVYMRLIRIYLRKR